LNSLGFKPSGLIVFLSDFGLKDHYACVVKGRILKELFQKEFLTFQPHFLDLTHEIPPQNVKKAALVLKFSYKYFPSGTIFLAIVDPGVGTERKAILVKTKEYLFVGPDNGLFTFIYRENRDFEVYELLSEKLLSPPYSSTFHGRDLFAPAIANLLLGKDPLTFLRPLEKEKLIVLDFPLPERIEGGYRLSVWDVDHFGNIITNFSKEDAKAPFEVCVNGKEVPLVKTYGEGREGEVIALFGSEGLLEIAIKNASAFSLLGYPEILIKELDQR